MNKHEPRIAVVGLGAVGGFFGARLAAGGVPVTFVARGETLRTLKRDGLHLESREGGVGLPKVEATDTPSEIGPVDYIILGVKTWQIADAAEVIRPLVGSDTAILPLLNGVEVSDQLSDALGRGHVLGGMCRIVAMKVAPNRIKHIGVDPFIAVGELDNHKSDRISTLVRTLQATGIAAKNPTDIHVSIWNKFLFIAPVSGVGAVTRVPLGVLRSVPQTRELVVQAMHEVHTVAATKRVTLAPDAVDKTMAFLDGIPPESTSSMQRDIMEGRPSELESINGAVVRIGRSLGVDTPLNQFIYASLLPMETRARGVGTGPTAFPTSDDESC